MKIYLCASNQKTKPYAIACFIILAALTLLFSGCLSLVKGEYFLSAKQYEKGAAVFKEEIIKDSAKPDNWYYMGRFLLAQEKYAEANSYLKKAAELDSYNDKYYFWLGISYGGLKKSVPEMESYRKAINQNPKHDQAYTYLGHAYLRKKQYTNALKNYDSALIISSYNPSALYNRALILYRTKQYKASKKDFKRYINEYGYSSKSLRAAAYLNRMGDFDYRIHRLNKKQIVFNKIEFLPGDKELSQKSREELQIAGHMLEKNKSLELHILAYEKQNITLARKKAFNTKRYLLDFFQNLDQGQVKISFFGVPEKIRYGQTTYSLNSSINLFAVPKKIIK